MRFIDARLHAVSSRNMYSEHGLEPLMRPSAGLVCHSLIVVSNCRPGSADCQAAYATSSHSARAASVFVTLPSVRRVSDHSPFFSTVSRNVLVMRTELLEF